MTTEAVDPRYAELDAWDTQAMVAAIWYFRE